MAQTYVKGDFAHIVKAAGTPGLMNLGWSPDPVSSPGSVAQRQIWLADRVIAELDPARGDVILDLGCGTGGLSRRLAESGRFRMIGINVDPYQLKVGARRGAGGAAIGYVAALAERLPLAGGCADAGVIVEMLSHVRDKRALWDEVTRVIRPGGRLVVAAITLAQPLSGMNRPSREHLDRLAGYFAERPEDVPRAEDLVEDLRCRGIQVQDHDFTDGVYGPRHEDMLGLLRDLISTDDAIRSRARSLAEREWDADADQLTEYLQDCVAMHAVRVFEYHLFSGRVG